MSDYQYHPIAAMFPLLEGAELQTLVSDIKENGLQEPVWIYEGKILDGRNRSTACMMAGVMLATRFFTGTEEEAIAFSWSMNGARRHLSEGQLALAGAKMRPALTEAASKARLATLKQNANTEVEPLPPRARGKTRDQAGAIVGVSGKLIDAGSRVIKHGSPEVIKAVESGKLPVTVAAKLSRLPHSHQTTAVQGGRAAIKAAIRPTNTPKEYPVSERLVKWIESLGAIETVIKQDYSGMENMLTSKGWAKTSTGYFIDLLGRLAEAFPRLHKEAKKYGDNAK